MPLTHTVELNAGTSTPTPARICTPTGRGRPRHSITTQISRLSQLWFEALAGICAHVRGGGGGLTPSDIAPARLSQQQIDELQRQYRIADILPLTPLQQGLLFHASTAQGSDDDVYAVQLDYHRDRRRLTRTGCAMRCTRWSTGIRTWRPDSATQFDEPVQIIPADPVPAWRYVELGAARRRRR